MLQESPCDTCTLYRQEITDYIAGMLEGDLSALTGIRSVLDIMINEERDSRIEQYIKDNPQTCGDPSLCIYRPERLGFFLEIVEGNLKRLKVAGDEERKRLSAEVMKLRVLPNLDS